MPHFFINSTQVNTDNIQISDKENYNHIVKSLRARAGERLLLIDENQIQYETIISSISNKCITANIINSYHSTRGLDFCIDLAQVPLANDGQNFIIEKATELGVNKVIPVYTDNCALKKSVIERKIPKWQKLMYESSKQCERAIVPICGECVTLEKLPNIDKYDKIIVFCERIATETIRTSFKKKPIKKGDNILVIVGPEGGFSQREFESFKALNFEMLTLGTLILRAETAVTVGLGNIIYEYTNFNK